MMIGAHLPNGPLTTDDLAVLAAGRFGAIKAMWYHSPEAVRACRRVLGPDTHVLVRLPDSSDTIIPSARDYAARCARHIQWMHDRANAWDFQLDNEPQYQHAWGPGAAWQWQAFMTDVIPDLKRQMPAGCRLGFTPLSHPALDLWLTATKRVAALCDFVCVHSYWQAADHRWHSGLGGNAPAFHAWLPDKPVVVTEFGSSISEARPALAPAEVEARMVAEYPGWLEWAAGLGYIEAAYVYLVGGTPDWEGFRVTRAVAAAMRP